MAQSLGINEAEFMDMFGEDLGMRMKLVYYPGMEDKTNVPLDHGIGVGPHKVRVVEPWEKLELYSPCVWCYRIMDFWLYFYKITLEDFKYSCWMVVGL
jgi:hypothetical protein